MNDILTKINLVLKDRKDKDPEKSYVASLNKKGLNHACNKIEEEANELVNALTNENKERVIS